MSEQTNEQRAYEIIGSVIHVLENAPRVALAGAIVHALDAADRELAESRKRESELTAALERIAKGFTDSLASRIANEALQAASGKVWT